jgi:hypothetical protein
LAATSDGASLSLSLDGVTGIDRRVAADHVVAGVGVFALFGVGEGPDGDRVPRKGVALDLDRVPHNAPGAVRFAELEHPAGAGEVAAEDVVQLEVAWPWTDAACRQP